MNFLDYGTDEVDYEHIHINILDGNVNIIYLMVSKIIYSAIGTDDTPCHGYYLIRFLYLHIIFKKT